MDTKHINDALDRIFHEDEARIVFWNDPEREFQNVLPFLLFDDVTTIRLDQTAALEVKIRLERDDPTGKYLLYSPTEEPDYESDWLLDIHLYSRSFRADRASILLDQLGLKNQHMRQHLADRRKFFDSKERLQKLKPLVAAADVAADLDRKMIAVVVRADQPEFFNIVRTLFHAYTEGGDEIDLDLPPPAWDGVEKFDLAAPFWEMARTAFGYADDNPSLKKLLIRLVVTDYAHHLKADVPTALVHLVLPPLGRSNAVVCLAQWRDSSSRGSSYDRLSADVASLVHLGDHLHGLEIDHLIDVMTFLDVEKAIASQLRERVQGTAATLNADEVRAVATRRQDGHWASPTVAGAPEVPRKALHAVYDALATAADFFALRNRHGSDFDYLDVSHLYGAYETDLFRFDQLYRHFCEAADQAEFQGWNILKPLRDDLEACYTNWFVPKLALAWGKFLEPQGTSCLLAKWRIDRIPNQQEFFERHVRPRLDEAGNRRAYVIISDAFRFEAAQELAQTLNGKYRFEATLASQLGVLPSYTALGMASLLPHKTLTYMPTGDVLVDGKPTSSTEQRDEILKSVGGMACKAGDLLAMKRDEGREFVMDKRVVYIYHNAVDAVGESASTEEKTFEGVRKAIDELTALVSYIINKLNGSHVVVTADHGFLFTESFPGEPEKSKLEQKPLGTVQAKKRYLIGHQLPDHEAAWHGKTKVTAGAEGEMEFWIPRATNRFHFTGGARFVHGGAMLQEVVVPVLTVREVEGKSAKETKTRPVTVQVLGSSHKITSNRHRFQLIQVEAVGERVKPVTLKVAVYEGGEPVTNVETVTFDSVSETMEERKRWVPLVLRDRPYDKKTAYRLVLRDAETGVEQQSVPVVIDRAIHDDF
ncbi:MAG: BREX-1 system phosphatase PglZ type A [Acidimicrobiia bacterium]|nr:BREX-1 system phosphatase PglZ type A [Acidimicrobiia bacterium]